MAPITAPKPFSTFALLLLLFLFFSSAAVQLHAADVAESAMTRIRVYYQETAAGPNQTAFDVATLPQSNTSSTSLPFGRVQVFDSPLTEGPLPSSKVIGRAQGITVVVSHDSAMLVEMNHVFTAGEFNGSTVATFGPIVPNVDAEYSVLGGSGRFRMARGYARRKLISATDTAYTVRFDIYVKP